MTSIHSVLIMAGLAVGTSLGGGAAVAADSQTVPAISPNRAAAVSPAMVASLRRIGSTEGFKPYAGNPILAPGPVGSFDAGALGSMCILRVGDVLHLYYEAWGVRTTKEWGAKEYETLQIGHATSTDGVHWQKDPLNPVLPRGGKPDFDRTGVWDPYVIHEDGLFKMWYGGGDGSQLNLGWAYATSTDGSHFKKKGLIGIGAQTNTEDCHVVRDPKSGLYYMYYWYGWDEPQAFKLVMAATPTGFDFNEARTLTIAGDDALMCKFGHVLRDDDGWHLFYSNFEGAHCPNSIVRYATSDDGIHWQARNKGLVKGHDADVLRVADDLYLMVYSPQGGFDANGTDIRLAVYNGRLPELANKPPLVPEAESRRETSGFPYRSDICRADEKENLAPEELKHLKGASNGGYHYLGVAKIMAPIGKAFAEAMAGFQKTQRQEKQ